MAPQDMRWVPGGTFLMGSNDFGPEERPQHEAHVSGFWIDRRPVTVRDFRRFTEATGYKTAAELDEAMPGPLVFRPVGRRTRTFELPELWRKAPDASWSSPAGRTSNVIGCEDDPVVHVSWADADAYARWAGKCLPTEAEWERAARGGLDGKSYAWGDELAPHGRINANTWQGDFPWQNLLSDNYFWTSPVQSFRPNRFGLYDMIGNVWEWTSDVYSPFPESIPFCCAPVLESTLDDGAVAELKVIKGGSFLCSERCRHYRPAARFGQHGGTSACHIGFRCVVRRIPEA
ncbi:MAG TPA: formylglycine-generating enzyme family protein [Candidatus Dormibacteraeota bacterium]|nr:formylglycine-generating enzyme family protein [Candidatus Dormibacteraeota bacterium]